MGFVVENHINDSNVNDVPRKNQAVVYGKAQYMWQVGTAYPSPVVVLFQDGKANHCLMVTPGALRGIDKTS